MDKLSDWNTRSLATQSKVDPHPDTHIHVANIHYLFKVLRAALRFQVTRYKKGVGFKWIQNKVDIGKSF